MKNLNVYWARLIPLIVVVSISSCHREMVKRKYEEEIKYPKIEYQVEIKDPTTEIKEIEPITEDNKVKVYK